MFFFSLQEGPLGWEVTAQCGEVSLVLWYSEEEEEDGRSDSDQASMSLALLSCRDGSMTTAKDIHAINIQCPCHFQCSS